MRNFSKIFTVLAVLFAAYGVSHAVTIDSIDFNGCISEAGATPITVTVTDPDKGTLSYDWQILNGPGAVIIGSGPEVRFDPPNNGPHPWPYKIKLRVTSSPSGHFAENIIEISVKVAGDVNGDGVCNALDLVQLRNHFMEIGEPGWIDADLNTDGTVNALDLVQVRNTFTQKAVSADPGTYFFDNFECGLGKWSVSGADWGLTNTSVAGGKFSFTDSPDGNYPVNANSITTTKGSIDLSTATHPVLTFWHKYSLAINPGYYDHVYVDVSDDGGVTWTNKGAWVGTQSTWVPVQIDLISYAGKAVKLRFALWNHAYGLNDDGWYVDNVEIKEWAGPA
jgi:hypothetical protein